MKRFVSELKILYDEEVERIHRTSIRILEEIGMKIPDEAILSLLEKNGAAVDWGRQVVRMPEPLVMKAMNGIKKDFREAPAYFGRRPELGRGELTLWMCSMPEVVELTSLEKRPVETWSRVERPGGTFPVDTWHAAKRRGTREDMLKGIAVGNALPNVGVIEPHGIPADVPQRTVDVYCYRYLYTFSQKPCSTWIYSLSSARRILEMARIIAQAKGEKELPLFYFADTVSPLRFAPHTLQIMKLMAAHRVPVYIGPMVTAGGSGPVTLAGTMAVANAEVLGHVLLIWLLNPSQALVYPGISTILDLRNALISLGAPEQALLDIAAVQMARYYGMSACCNAHLSDSNLCDFQRGYEAAATLSFALAAGVEMIGIVGFSGAGIISSNPGCQSLEQLIIDNECVEYMRRMLRGFEVNEETLAFEVIRSTGIGGTFIDKDHTAAHMRKEHYFPDLFNRDSYETWVKKGKRSLEEKAHERLNEILTKHYPPEPVIDSSIEKLLDDIFQEALSDA
jgi:trimethylamine--corrinoid protein Co-methyltransferase